MEVCVGTSGFSYDMWLGGFYPAGTRTPDMLRHYGTRLPAVEINNTFYRMPKTEVVQGWAGDVPADFKFTFKASRQITHVDRLTGVESSVQYLLERVQPLGPRLGALLFQLPPDLHANVDRLADFLGLFPRSVPVAMEFRHPSWFDREIYECLAMRGAALCAADHDGDTVEAPLEPTADWGYLRLRRETYDEAQLSAWLERVLAKEDDWYRAFVFFMHEEGGADLALRFAELARAAGADVRAPNP